MRGSLSEGGGFMCATSHITFSSSPSDHSFTQTLIAALRLVLHPQIICYNYIVVLEVFNETRNFNETKNLIFTHFTESTNL